MNPLEMLITAIGWIVMLALGAAIAVGGSHLLLAFVRWIFAG